MLQRLESGQVDVLQEVIGQVEHFDVCRLLEGVRGQVAQAVPSQPQSVERLESCQGLQFA